MNEMAPRGEPSLLRDGDRLRVVAHDNLCLIRSGQDWSDIEPERKMYLDDVEPVLREGMEFPARSGCGDRLLRQPVHARARR